MIIEFTDNDFAVIQDSLTTNRERIRGMGMPTPNMDETMSRWGKWAHPSGCQFLVVTGEDADLIAAVTEPVIENHTPSSSTVHEEALMDALAALSNDVDGKVLVSDVIGAVARLAQKS